MGVSALTCKPGSPQAFCQSLSRHLENGHSKLTSTLKEPGSQEGAWDTICTFSATTDNLLT